MNLSISIIIPTYNRAHLIGETLDSVLTQTYTNWECIVVDDGSTDDTAKVVQEFQKKHNAISYVNRPDRHARGGSGARNFGLAMAKGDYVQFLDSDDVLLPTCLAERANKLGSVPDLLVCMSATFYKEPGDRDLLWNYVSPDEQIGHLLLRFANTDMPWSTNSVTWRKEFLLSIEGWDEKLVAWQDWELHIRALAHNPLLIISELPPDNFVRLDNKDRLGKKRSNKSYQLAIRKALASAEECLLSNNCMTAELKLALKRFVLRHMLHQIFRAGDRARAGSWILKSPFFKSIGRLRYAAYFILEYLNSSTKLRKFFTKEPYDKYLDLIKAKSTHLALRYSQFFSSTITN